MLKEKKDDLHHLFVIIRYLQDRLWKSKLCLRGAITRGKMYWPKKEENILLGPAMLEAYALESKIAIYPRIVVSEGLSKWISDNEIKADSVIQKEKLEDAIRQDKDGVYFFDILNPSIVRKQDEKIKSGNGWFSISIGNKPSNYSGVLKSIEEIIRNNMTKEDEKTKQKYNWLNSYIEESRRE